MSAEKRTTPLQRYLNAIGVPSAAVEAALRARLEGRAPSRKQMARWRQGRVDIRRTDMVRILWAVRAASGNPDVQLEQLFDLDPANDANWRD